MLERRQQQYEQRTGTYHVRAPPLSQVAAFAEQGMQVPPLRYVSDGHDTTQAFWFKTKPGMLRGTSAMQGNGRNTYQVIERVCEQVAVFAEQAEQTPKFANVVVGQLVTQAPAKSSKPVLLERSVSEAHICI